MLTMLSILFVDRDRNRPVKCIMDKAYCHTEHLSRNKGQRMSVEMSFNNIVHKFTHIDEFVWHRILQDGHSNWSYL
jgi:hypothetical protein